MSNNHYDLLNKILEKQDKMSEDISDIKLVNIKQEENLRLHMYRTELAEQNIEILKKELVPVKKHVDLINAAVKIIASISILVGIVVGIVETIAFFKK